jgi:hypothetical protein
VQTSSASSNLELCASEYGDSDLFEKMDANTKISCIYTILRLIFFASFCARLALKFEIVYCKSDNSDCVNAKLCVKKN